MKKVLIDLNIILDFLNKRNFHQEAALLINMCAESKLSRIPTYTPEQFFLL